MDVDSWDLRSGEEGKVNMLFSEALRPLTCHTSPGIFLACSYPLSRSLSKWHYLTKAFLDFSYLRTPGPGKEGLAPLFHSC
jgi:hypothetical protein